MFNRRNIFMAVMLIVFSLAFVTIILPDFANAATCTCNVSNQKKRCPVHKCYGAPCNHGRVDQNGQTRLSPQETVRVARDLQRLSEDRDDQYWRNLERAQRLEERRYSLEQRKTRDNISNSRSAAGAIRAWRDAFRR